MSIRRGAVVLAGGRSERMGRDKATIPVGDVAAVVHVVRVMAEVCETVVVVAAPGQTLPPLPAGTLREDDPPDHLGEGPLRGIETGLRRLAADGIELAYLGACDGIAVTATHVDFVLGRLARPPEPDAVAPASGSHLHPLAAAVRVAPALATATALLAAGRRAAHDLLDALHTVTIPVDALPDPDALAEANTPAQWAAALRKDRT